MNVPVVRGAERLRLTELAAALEQLSQRARAGQLTPEDVQEGTFTISNLGMYGVDTFTAIVNPPRAAILAVGRATQQVVVRDDESTSVEPLASFTLTADHRIVHGAPAATFLGEVKRLVEQPALML
jgi:pyruvate dehydrogenase E2 component (dihydrolipoamide acetyltransferase)